MRKVLTLCLIGAVAFTCSSCSCKRCNGFGTEVAMTSGYHPYTKKNFKANETIPCLKCGGSGQSGANPNAGAFSGDKAFSESLMTPKTSASSTGPVHLHTHYNRNTYVTPAYY